MLFAASGRLAGSMCSAPLSPDSLQLWCVLPFSVVSPTSKPATRNNAACNTHQVNHGHMQQQARDHSMPRHLRSGFPLLRWL